MGAKYNNEGEYEKLMTNYLISKGESTQGINLNDAEESFVNDVNKAM